MKISNQTNRPCWLYILECTGGGLYVGISENVNKRYKQHCGGNGALYTKLNPPLRLLAQQHYPSRKEAMRAEREFKRMNKVEKYRWVRALSGDLSIS